MTRKTITAFAMAATAAAALSACGSSTTGTPAGSVSAADSQAIHAAVATYNHDITHADGIPISTILADTWAVETAVKNASDDNLGTRLFMPLDYCAAAWGKLDQAIDGGTGNDLDAAQSAVAKQCTVIS